MNSTPQVMIALVGITCLLLLVLLTVYAVGWLVGVFLLRVPLVGRRHRTGRLRGREPIDTASSKLSRHR